MALLNDEIAQKVKQQLADLDGPVRLVMFTQEFECEYCADTRQMVEEIAALSDKLTAEVYDFVEDKQEAEALGVDKIPAVAVVGSQDYGVRFYGIPSGYEFASFLHAMRLVSTGEAGLSTETLGALAGLQAPIHIQVFVTPTCPFCQGAVVLAHQLAVASSMVRGDMVEATEFPHVVTEYQVMGVPRTVINESVHIEGAVPEAVLVEKLQQALAQEGEQ